MTAYKFRLGLHKILQFASYMHWKKQQIQDLKKSYRKVKPNVM